MKREEGGQIFMEKGREMTEGREEIEEERIDGDEEKSTSLPWGMKMTIREGCWQQIRAPK